MDAFRCNECGYETLSEKYYCPKCRNSSFSRLEIEGNGQVYSFTTIHIAPPKFAEKAPYQVVLVQLTERLRVTGYMDEAINIGDSVSFKEIQEGAYIFQKSS
ncbi:Zn-ribbon domain-containing OB-fold protein [Alkalibacillus haloalkaliphilus]|uniref:Zn-ribbon domain-containing OB-fold protein n=1 Tax=Alkalibacillus haloalkaliphilus TaxID=94136 RepID=UPI0003010B93|nr:OB-fold domain-containing protein [Alkalibacillus haloalkaliphilus]